MVLENIFGEVWPGEEFWSVEVVGSLGVCKVVRVYVDGQCEETGY